MRDIELKGMLSIPFLKKERFTGSCKKMRYMLCMEEGQIKATIYPGPYCFEMTPDEKKESEFFDASTDGLGMAVDWLNQMYREKYQ